MAILRLANRNNKKINLDDEGSYIEVANDITKRDFNRLIEIMPDTIDEEKGISIKQGTDLTAGFFDVFVKGWSLEVPATVESYLDLPRESAEAIDAKLMEHFTNLTPGEAETKKSGK